MKPPAEIKFSYKSTTGCKGENMLSYLVNTRRCKLYYTWVYSKILRKQRNLRFCSSEWLVNLVVVQMLVNHACHLRHESRCCRHWQRRWKMQRRLKTAEKAVDTLRNLLGKHVNHCWSHTKSFANCKMCTMYACWKKSSLFSKNVTTQHLMIIAKWNEPTVGTSKWFCQLLWFFDMFFDEMFGPYRVVICHLQYSSHRTW